MERSKAAKYAASVFYEKFNDFDIYMEDTAIGYPKIVASFLSKALGNNLALDRVFPLGQRGDVINAAKTRPANGRRAAYIVDGDLYLLSGEREEIPNNVVVLPRYCIENFMLDEQAILDIMDEEHVSMSREAMNNSLQLSEWLAKSSEHLKDLFRYFAAAHHLRAEIPTVSRGYRSVCATDQGDIDSSKCHAIVKEIQDHLISKYGIEELNKAIHYVDNQINPEKCFTSTYVSAKDFSLPLLILKIKTICPIKVPHTNLKLRIAMKCASDPFIEVANSLRRILNIPPHRHLQLTR